MKKFLLFLVLVGIAVLIYLTVWKKPEQTYPPTQSPQSAPATQPQAPIQKTNGTDLFEQGKYKAAVKQLESELANGQSENPARHLSLIATSYDQLNDPRKAVAIWGQVIKRYPNDSNCAQACYESGRLSKDKNTKMKFFEKLAGEFPDSHWAQAVGAPLGDYYLGSRDSDGLYKSRHFYSLALRGKLSSLERNQIKKEVTKLNQKLIFSSLPTPDSTIYKVQPSDTIWNISRKFKVEAGGDQVLGHIKRVNRLQTSNIYPDDKLKIITGKFHLELSKNNFSMALYLDGDFIKEYPVAIGHLEDSPTPLGTYHVTGKTPFPPWTKRDARGMEEIPYGDPRNILGTRWMSFKERPRLGIHGTTVPQSIGQAVTNGCLRMYNKDVEELYDLIPNGTKVIIHD